MFKYLAFSYSVFSFAMYGLHCLNANFFPLFFASLNYSQFQISLIIFLAQISYVFASLIINKLALRFSPKLVSKAFALLSFIILPIIFYVHSFIIMCILFPVRYLFFRSSYLTESQSMLDLENNKFSFSKVRAIGSIGYVAIALSTGIIYDYFKVPGIIWVTVITTLIYSFFTYNLAPNIINKKNESTEKFDYTVILPILILYFLTWTSLAPAMMYSSLYLKEIGFSGLNLGTNLVIAVGAEIILMLNFDKIIKIFSIRKLLFCSILLGSLRYIVLLSTTNKTIITCSQILHIFNFAIPYLCGNYYLRKKLSSENFLEGQAYMTTAFSSGYFVGQLTCVLYSYQITSNLELVNAFWFSIAFCFFAFLYLLKIFPKLT